MLSGNHLNGMARRKVTLLSGYRPKRKREAESRWHTIIRPPSLQEQGMTRSEWRAYLGFLKRFPNWCRKWNPELRIGNARPSN